MNEHTVKILCEITNDFYRQNSESFSATRSMPWPGWQRCVELLTPAFKGRQNISVLDLACGNLRFEQYFGPALSRTTGTTQIVFYAVDACDELALQHSPAIAHTTDNKSSLHEGTHQNDRNNKAMAAVIPTQLPCIHYQSLDILTVLLDGETLDEQLTAPVCDISVAFGFMHHVPAQAYRKTVLSSLIKHTKPGGYVIVSLWQFLKNAVLRKKARSSHEQALKKLSLPQLDANDYLLGWKDTTDQFRYCHSFSEAEIDALTTAVSDKATEVARFTSDGKTQDLNTYIVLKVL